MTVSARRKKPKVKSVMGKIASRKETPAIRRRAIKVALDLLLFESQGLQFVYSPSMNLTAYGNTSPEAMREFLFLLKIHFEEVNKMGTMRADLIKHGWKIKGDKLQQPSLADVVKKNWYAADVVNLEKFRKTTRIVDFPPVP